MITNDDKNVAIDGIEVENGGVHKNIVECDMLMIIMLKIML